MRLHTREQAPKEGQAPSEPAPSQKYVPTHADYLRFLVDSQHVYQAFEDVVNERDELAVFRNTGLERTVPLAADIDYMVKEYKLTLPEVGKAGTNYATHLREIQSISEFICHFYNFYFAHTAGGRMIGKQMSSLLLDGRTLDFYKWDSDLNKLKAAVKDDIEAIAASWSEEERTACIDATPDTFRLAGAINKYLSGNAEE
jgi:heme oxygenase